METLPPVTTALDAKSTKFTKLGSTEEKMKIEGLKTYQKNYLQKTCTWAWFNAVYFTF